jgi:hypothetical protein
MYTGGDIAGKISPNLRKIAEKSVQNSKIFSLVPASANVAEIVKLLIKLKKNFKL